MIYKLLYVLYFIINVIRFMIKFKLFFIITYRELTKFTKFARKYFFTYILEIFIKFYLKILQMPIFWSLAIILILLVINLLKLANMHLCTTRTVFILQLLLDFQFSLLNVLFVSWFKYKKINKIKNKAWLFWKTLAKYYSIK